jgi:hypothetical protein
VTKLAGHREKVGKGSRLSWHSFAAKLVGGGFQLARDPECILPEARHGTSIREASFYLSFFSMNTLPSIGL